MKELEPAINQIVDLIKGSKEFILSQAPDFIRQFIIYSYMESLLGIIFPSLILVLIGKFLFSIKNKKCGDIKEFEIALGIIGVIIGIAMTCAVIINFNDICTIYFAPKIYIAMNLAECLKGQN